MTHINIGKLNEYDQGKNIYVPAISSFYQNEYMTLTFGEYTGRPSDFIDFHKSDLVYFLADGWKVDGVLAKSEGGKWTVEARALSEQAGTGTATEASSSTESSASGSSSSYSHSAGASANTQEGGPYWFAWSRIRLVRKRLQGDKVTDYMMRRLTEAYNNGRSLNEARYNELCKLYVAMLNATQDTVDSTNAASVLPQAFTSLEDEFARRMRAVAMPNADGLDGLASNIDARVNDWLASREDEINRQFDARLEQAKSQMVTAGTYNGTVWPTVAAGIERERQYALNNLKDAFTGLEASLAEIKAKVFSMRIQLTEAQRNAESAILDARTKLRSAANNVTADILKNRTNLLELRNGVAKAMLDFMERREDDYPDLETILDTVARLDNQSVDPGGTGGTMDGHDTQTVLPNPTLPTLPPVTPPAPGT